MTRQALVFLLIIASAGAAASPTHAAHACFSRTIALPGGAASQFAMGLRYIYGNGVERDHVCALMWFYIAASFDVERGRVHIGLVEPYMSMAQKNDAHELAQYYLDNAIGGTNRAPASAASITRSE